MDTITHAISGAVVGAATASKDGSDMRRRALWGALFAAFPDSDFALMLFTDHFTYLNEHRGYTHSIVMLPAWAALLGLLGLLGAHFSRDRWRDMASLAAAALAAHILGDLVTSYGTKVFKPVSDVPLAYPITFIIDPIFTLILATGLAGALWKRRRAIATTAGVVLGAYLLMQAWLQHEAAGLAERYAVSIGYPEVPVLAFPQPFSPFNWKLVVVADGRYHQAYVDFLARNAPAPSGDAGAFQRIRSAYQPANALDWKRYPRWPEDKDLRELAFAAWSQPAFAGFREFALLPYVTSIRGDTRRVCVWFTDMRFTLHGVNPPFEYAMCRVGRDWVLDLQAEKQGDV